MGPSTTPGSTSTSSPGSTRSCGASAELGVQADLILFHPYDRWGFSDLGPAVDDRLVRYVVRRLAGYAHVWFSLANEHDLVFTKSTADWDRIGELVAAEDPHGHLVSIHNFVQHFDHTRPWISHASVQGSVEAIATGREQWGKPVVVDECGYEGDLEYGWGNLSGEELLHRFWEGAVRGGYVGHGETYWDAEDEIWWSKGGRLVGTSPARIGFLEEVVAASPTGVLEPLPSDFDLPWAGVQDEYLVSYHGRGRPRERHVLLPPGQWRVDVLDTWECTVRPVARRAQDVRVGAAARQALPGRTAGGGLMRTSITPGQVWLDTDGNRIHAHGGSILEVDGTFYWYGENKERSTPGSGIWHWGVRCYSSTDLYNWTDRGLIIPPDVDDPTSPLHPAMAMDRPHILRHPGLRAVRLLDQGHVAGRSALDGAGRRRPARAVPHRPERI